MKIPRKPKIHALVVNGDLEGVKVELERGADPNRIWIDGLTPFHLAVDEANMELVQVLVAAGSDPAATCDPYHQDASQLAALRGATEIVRLLVDLGLNPARADDRGWTALHYAASGGEGTLTTVLYLLELGVPMDAQNVDGETALIRAAISSNLAVVHALVSRGANLAPVPKHGWDALTAAKAQLSAALEHLANQRQIRVARDAQDQSQDQMRSPFERRGDVPTVRPAGFGNRLPLLRS